MAERRPKPGMTIIYWGVPALVVAAYGALCVYDGWFREDYAKATANKWMAGGCLIAVAWVISQGVKEYRKVRRLAEGQGDAVQTGEESPADTPEGGVDREN